MNNTREQIDNKNAKMNVAWGDILSQRRPKINPPGRAMIPVAVWNVPRAVPFKFGGARSTTNAL